MKVSVIHPPFLLIKRDWKHYLQNYLAFRRTKPSINSEVYLNNDSYKL